MYAHANENNVNIIKIYAHTFIINPSHHSSVYKFIINKLN